MGKITEPSWADKDYDPEKVEDYLLEWRDRHSTAYVELAELCGLARWVGGTIEETSPDHRNPERVQHVLDSLKTLIEIDPDGRR